VGKVFLPAIDIKSTEAILDVCRQYPGYAYPMVGLHPEEVRADWRDVLAQMKQYLKPENRFIAIGEVGLDYYWSREFEQEQLDAFEEQVKWSVETRLPLMIHCRKGQNEMVQLLRRYKNDLPGGVFHCFTGNEHEAEELLQFDNFVLGIGGVLTFKKSHLPEVLPAAVPLDRIVIETDSPYMAPVPMRGQRNESAYVKFVLQRLAEAYGVSEEVVATTTTATAQRIFPLAFAE
jgi:TatD DNase family protein